MPAGVVAVCAEYDSEQIGLAASSFTSVSLEPALVTVCMRKESDTWPRLQRSPRIGISVLGENNQAAVRALSAKTGDRFAGLTTHVRHGALFIEDSSLWLSTTLEGQINAGDHVIVVLRIVEIQAQPEVSPIVFYRSDLHRLERRQS